jgi:WD40 repeat protein
MRCSLGLPRIIRLLSVLPSALCFALALALRSPRPVTRCASPDSCTARLLNLGPTRQAPHSPHQVHTSGINSLLISGDGKTLVTCSKDGSAGIWELESGAVLGVVRGHADGIVCAAISPDGSLLMSGSYDGAVQLSRVPDGSTLLSLSHDARPVALCLSPNCGLLAVALDGGAVAVWALGGDLSTPAAVLPASKAPINGIVFSTAGDLLVVWGQDCCVGVWAVGGGPEDASTPPRQVALFAADAAITCCAFLAPPTPTDTNGDGNGDACGQMLAAGDAGGAVHFLDFPSGLLMAGL